MATYKIPGVYVEEIPSLPSKVVQVATAIPAFVGYTEKAPVPNLPVRLSSMVEFRKHFGGPATAITLSATNIFDPGTQPTASTTFILYYAMQMFFANGGGACWVMSCGDFLSGVDEEDMIGTTGTGGAFAEIAKEDEPTLLLAPDAFSLGVDDYYSVVKAMLNQCGALKDRFTVLDLFPTASSHSDMATKIGNQNLSYGAAYHPLLITTLPYPDEAVAFASTGINTNLKNKKLSAVVATAAKTDGTGPATAAALNPVLSIIRKKVGKLQITLPASSAVVGVYARVDRTRGVWKAPANASVTGVEAPKELITHDDQKLLNDPTHGKVVNVIRRFKGKGNLIWGARTLEANSLEWRYVPVRRLFIMVEESIMKATEPLVFEPNDANTWSRVRAMIENFLTSLWRDGALQGATPKEAFYVNAGLGTTMTAQDILNGYLNIEVGIAAVRPAEFVILKFSHKLQES